jgi:hypothetical protein
MLQSLEKRVVKTILNIQPQMHNLDLEHKHDDAAKDGDIHSFGLEYDDIAKYEDYVLEPLIGVNGVPKAMALINIEDDVDVNWCLKSILTADKRKRLAYIAEDEDSILAAVGSLLEEVALSKARLF